MMNAIRGWSLVAMLVGATIVSVASPARSQGGARLTAEDFKLYGGTFHSDCANLLAPRVTLFEDAIVFIDGDRRIAGSKVELAGGWYGNHPPPDFAMAFMAYTPAGRDIVLALFEDDSGRFALLDGGDIDPSIAGKMKFHDCTSRKTETAAAKPTPAPAVSPSPDSMDAAGMLAVPKFKAAYLKALGRRARTPWLASLDGPSPPARKVTVAGSEYLLVTACKNHECDENNLVLLWSAPRGVVYGMIHEGGRSTHIGKPSPAVARELGALWRAEWRSQR